MERYHPVVSIMLSYMNLKKHSVKIRVVAKWKSTKFFGVTYRTFLSNATTFRKDSDNKRRVRMKHIS